MSCGAGNVFGTMYCWGLESLSLRIKCCWMQYLMALCNCETWLLLCSMRHITALESILQIN